MSMLYIGVDIGGTATKYGVFTVEGKLISKWEAPTALGQHGSGILPAVAGQLTSWVASHGYAMEQIAGVGSGIILDGKMIHGAKGLGGEVGHIVVDPTEPEQCRCAGNVQ